MKILTEKQVTELCVFIESQIKDTGCDHSLKNTFEWAKSNEIDRDNLIDVLEMNGGYCDCEVTMNLPENCDLEIKQELKEADSKNPFKIPLKFEQDNSRIYTKAIFSTSKFKQNNYTNEGEMVIPAPHGHKPKKRMKKSMHFFTGMKTEMPTELAIVKEIEPINSKEFSKKIRDSKLESFEKFSSRVADYYLSRIDKIEIGKPIGSHFMEKRGIRGKSIELRIHKVILGK